MRELFALILLAASTTAFAQDNVSIDCAAFQKQPNGSYRVISPTTVKIGNSTMQLSNTTFGPHTLNIGGADLYEAISHKCPGTNT